MARLNLNQVTNSEMVDPNWKVLYKVGGSAALIMVLIILTQFIVFIAWPPPLEGSVLDWFRLFQDNWLLGLVSFEFLMIIYMVLSLFMFLALYIALRNVNRSLTSIYLTLSLVGVAAFIFARPVIEMLFLSSQYAAATTDMQKSMLLATGEGMIAIFNGTSFHVSYILGSISGLIISTVMLKSNIFSKSTAYIRIASSVLDFGIYVPKIGIFISMVSVVFLLIWNILIARKLFQLGRF